MIIEEVLKEKIFSINKFSIKKVKSSIADKDILYLENRLKAIKQSIDIY